MKSEKDICDDFSKFITAKDFPCIGAKTAAAKGGLHLHVAGHIGCGRGDREILDFLYDFVDLYRADTSVMSSAAVLFDRPTSISEQEFETYFWQRLQSLSDMDAVFYPNDKRVAHDYHSPDYSYSVKEEGFFLLGLHPASSRPARRFAYPGIVFNPHAQFEQLKGIRKYEPMKAVVRKRDLLFAGSINPMLQDHGQASEILQYSEELRQHHGMSL